jgi:hypothetical protein
VDFAEQSLPAAQSNSHAKFPMNEPKKRDYSIVLAYRQTFDATKLTSRNDTCLKYVPVFSILEASSRCASNKAS